MIVTLDTNIVASATFVPDVSGIFFTQWRNLRTDHINRQAEIYPRFDPGTFRAEVDQKMQIINWPSVVTAEVKEVVHLLQALGNATELRACADMLNANRVHSVPHGVLQALSRAVFDNPKLALNEG
jgi:hypothetical protein